MEYILIYVTCKDFEEAKKISKALLSQRLVACANILPEISSMFWWEGKIDQANEVPIILKTLKELSTEVINKIKSLHSYECPCIIGLPIEVGYEGFLKWIKEETRR